MAGYTKLWSDIVHSTIWREEAHVRLVWITMLAISDRNGYVGASLPGLADAARVTVDEAREALIRLAAPDPDSRTKDHEGRRITDAEGGWTILNYLYHREREAGERRRVQVREAVRRHRAKKKPKDVIAYSDSVTNGKRGKPMQKHRADAEAEKNIHVRFWALYPTRAGGNPRGDAEKALRARLAEGIPLDSILEGTTRYRAYCEATGAIGTQYVKMAKSWLSPSYEGWAQPWNLPITKPDPMDERSPYASDFES